MIDAVPLLSEDEARTVVATLDALRSSWILRDQSGRFATLGRSMYLDLCAGRGTLDSYGEQAAQQNEMLLRHYAGLLERIRACVEREMGETTVLTRDWALPGFHIFQGPGLRKADTGAAHFDLQFRALIGDRPLQMVRPLSFTLALALPRQGSGLRMWPIRPEQADAAMAQHRVDTLAEYLARKPSIFVPYHVGTLYLQREPLLHCIDYGGSVEAEDRRITLQGHGIRNDTQIVLYW